MPCSNKYGDDYKYACIECARLSSQPANMQKCMGCIARVSKVACSNEDAQCWNPRTADHSTCQSCTTDAKDSETCFACLKSQPYSDSCSSCLLLEDAAQQAKCYNCTKFAGLPDSTCYNCVKLLEDDKSVDQCLQCATNTKASVEGRSWCPG
jgi:hypothetical protein